MRPTTARAGASGSGNTGNTATATNTGTGGAFAIAGYIGSSNAGNRTSVVDRDTQRWDRFMPGNLIPIISPDTFRAKHADAIIVTAAMFYKEIVRDLVNSFDYKGDIITLTPLPHVLDAKEIEDILKAS